MMRLIDFGSPPPADWTVVNDGVMGGRSAGTMELSEEGTAVFSGLLSLENNGGFASTHADMDVPDLTGFSGVGLRVKGDGRSYQLRLRTEGDYDGVAYKSEFATEENGWMEIYLPFSGFQPTFRGRLLGNAPPLNLGAIRQIGFLIGDKTEGAFRLEIAWISAVLSEQ